MIELHTFSIVARDPRTGDIGVGVVSARPSVGSLVPWVSRHGAIATQGRVSGDLARRGLTLIEHGIPVDVALATLLADDADRDTRQLHGVDARRTFCHTGSQCVPWAGLERGGEWSVAGNMLAGPQIIGAMAGAFRRTGRLALVERLLIVLEAGQEAGGDTRGKRSAAVLVASPTPRLSHNLRVDDHPDPVAELRRVHDAMVAEATSIEQDYAGPGLFDALKY